LHESKSFAYKDKPVKALHSALNEVLLESITEGITHQVPDRMMQALKNDVFIFSGMKTYAQLKEASQLLTTSTGEIKPYYQFSEDVKKINATYNDNYLQAEYLFATGSAQMAANWSEIDMDNDLQYRTAQDDRVRAEHAAMANITLPARDKFWNKYYPPNGWNCRCTAVEVLPGKYKRTDTDEAERLGDAGTTRIGKDGKNADEIFRFNPGKQQRIFPPKHPYYAQHCGKKLNLSCNIRMATILLANEREKCGWQKDLQNTLVSQKIKEFKNGGSIASSVLVDKLATDYPKVLKCCEHFAKKGEQTEILPKVHKDDPAYKNFFGDLIGTKYEGKCPDFRVGKKYYELEGFLTKKPEKALYNMMKRGLKQSSRIVIEDAGLSLNEIKRTVFYRRRGGVLIDEVWLYKNGDLKQVL
jgi:SPP1 gp7 family putative phage head morphogenesis protein